jgi:hypothetical protein
MPTVQILMHITITPIPNSYELPPINQSMVGLFSVEQQRQLAEVATSCSRSLCSMGSFSKGALGENIG